MNQKQTVTVLLRKFIKSKISIIYLYSQLKNSIKKSIKLKSIFLLIFATIVPGLIITSISYRINSEALKRQYIEENSKILNTVEEYIYTQLKNLDMLNLSVYTNSDINQIAESNHISYLDDMLLKTNLMRYCQSNTDIYQIFLWLKNDNKAYLSKRYECQSVFMDTPIEFPEQFQGYKAYLQPAHVSSDYSMNEIYLVNSEQYRSNDELVFTVSRPIYRIPGMEILGYISIDVKTSAFGKVASLAYSRNEEFYITTEKIETIFTSENQIDLIRKDISDIAIQSENGIADGPADSLIFYSTLYMQDYGLKIIKVSYYDDIFTEAKNIVMDNILILIIFILISAILTTLITTRITARIQNLCRYIRAVDSGRLDEKIEDYTDITNEDEIGILSHNLSQMVSAIKRMYEHEYQIHLSNVNSQLKMLQAQINPHFMNNVLQSIGCAALEKDKLYVYNMISSLGKMMKYSMDTDQNIHTVREEMEYIRLFLMFHKEKIGKKFEYEINIDDASLDLEIPKMIIQPLLENCFKHGYQGRVQVFTVRIQVKVLGETLQIFVSDNGPGIDSELVASLNHHTNNSESIGLNNIYRRLQLFYENDFLFNINNIQPHGVMNTIILKIRKDHENEALNNG